MWIPNWRYSCDSPLWVIGVGLNPVYSWNVTFAVHVHADHLRTTKLTGSCLHGKNKWVITHCRMENLLKCFREGYFSGTSQGSKGQGAHRTPPSAVSTVLLAKQQLPFSKCLPSLWINVIITLNFLYLVALFIWTCNCTVGLETGKTVHWFCCFFRGLKFSSHYPKLGDCQPAVI